jgi:hypothetical protein
VGTTVAIVLYLTPLIVLILVWNWLLPLVEIAPKGQTRLERVRKGVVTIILGLFVAGISRKLFV